MRILCPNCASKGCEREPPGLHCKNCGLSFHPDDGLICIEDAVRLGKALTHRTRRAIVLAFWKKDELTPKQIADALDEGVGHVSYHIAVLRRMDPPVLMLSRTRKVNGATEHFYRVNNAY